MKKFKIVYETGTNQSSYYIVKAINKYLARKKADELIQAEFKSFSFAYIKELKPVDFLVHERMIKERDEQIEKLKRQIDRIQRVTAESSWTREAAQRDGGGFTDAEKIRAYENKW